MREVRHFDPYESDFQAIQQEKPDIILLGIPQFAEEGRFDRLANIAPTYLFENPVDDWRQTLRTVGKLLGKASEAERAIHEYNQKAEAARSILKHSIGDRSVALVRVYADGDIRLYGGPNGYTGSVLYGDLGLRPPKLVHDLIWGSSEWMKKITFDMLSELDAQRLLIVVDEAGRQQAWKMTSSEQWKSVPAVREGNVYEVRSDIWMTHGLHAHYAKEPWRFILFMEEGRRTFAEAVMLAYSKEEVEKWGEKMMHQYCELMQAHLLIVIEADPRQKQFEDAFSAAAAFIQNLQLLAWERKVGVVWKTNDYNWHPKFLQAVGVKRGERVVGTLHLGYFSDNKVPRPKMRTPIRELLTVHHE
ncbi:ABC transporter substrate-binding protein [Brevibacillus porteri]|uniref:ABC transporter substrate-binding protein n=1 Tax=Brevibacillus porteri TaxID=2126350 RepID=UPI0011B22B27|nr:ABC transporter substrate-binding protein [Brevibacillus porteri]MED1799185.1 ABC transporter substrate-binding protein [Brevibacillus porteri]MED2132427.1 ABC transporter substrate-binding protein [Brevibacillus porteri]MED2744510.1 ABC transporter substrate-binding protein [Brevibacillus porteri]MED2814954.1 ABC transporter substrate-binding protein [Brevibacillus porteri]MED2895600.1 ABC transporter substrate-binding protein [Brevibacillus porteri]